MCASQEMLAHQLKKSLETGNRLGAQVSFGQKECIYAQGRKMPIIKCDFVWSV